MHPHTLILAHFLRRLLSASVQGFRHGLHNLLLLLWSLFGLQNDLAHYSLHILLIGILWCLLTELKLLGGINQSISAQI